MGSMFESDIMWIEFATQVSLTFSYCYMQGKLVGYKRLKGNISGVVPVAVIYFIWKIFNEILMRCPEIITDNMTRVVIYRTCTGLVVTFLISPLFCQGTWTKRLLMFFPMEIFGGIAYLCRALFMLFLRWSGLYDIVEKNLIVLLIIRILIENLSYLMCCWVFAKQIKKFRESELKNKKICWMIISVTIGVEIASAIILSIKGGDYRGIWVLFIFTTATCTAVVFRINMIKKENERIYLQKQLMDNHYSSVHLQIEQTEKIRKEIGSLIKIIDSMKSDPQAEESDIERYKEELRAFYQQMKTTDYCGNIVLNAILYNKVQKCEAAGIDLIINMQDIKTGQIRDMDLFDVCNNMLETAIYTADKIMEGQKKRIAITAKNIAGQIVIETTCPAYEKETKNNKFVVQGKRIIKRRVKSLGGQYLCGSDGGTERMTVSIPCEE